MKNKKALWFKKKSPTVSDLKKKLWKLFSEYIRRRDAKEDIASCCTCGMAMHWKKLQAGHFIPGRKNAILFDERGCHAQCYACNCGWLKGNPRMYDRFMRARYGDQVIKELEDLNYGPAKQFTIPELEGMIENYKLKLKSLCT